MSTDSRPILHTSLISLGGIYAAHLTIVDDGPQKTPVSGEAWADDLDWPVAVSKIILPSGAPGRDRPLDLVFSVPIGNCCSACSSSVYEDRCCEETLQGAVTTLVSRANRQLGILRDLYEKRLARLAKREAAIVKSRASVGR